MNWGWRSTRILERPKLRVERHPCFSTVGCGEMVMHAAEVRCKTSPPECSDTHTYLRKQRRSRCATGHCWCGQHDVGAHWCVLMPTACAFAHPGMLDETEPNPVNEWFHTCSHELVRLLPCLCDFVAISEGSKRELYTLSAGPSHYSKKLLTLFQEAPLGSPAFRRMW